MRGATQAEPCRISSLRCSSCPHDPCMPQPRSLPTDRVLSLCVAGTGGQEADLKASNTGLQASRTCL